MLRIVISCAYTKFENYIRKRKFENHDYIAKLIRTRFEFEVARHACIASGVYLIMQAAKLLT